LAFLAYFQLLKKYQYVRPSVVDSTPQGIDRARFFMVQSIAYSPKTCTKEGIFCRTSPGTKGGILLEISLHFHVKIGLPINNQDFREGDR
jgi:hypothetical protein